MLEVEKYFKQNKRVGSFGIQYLDDKLSGILKSDLVLLGARSGAGKTTIANSIAMSNIKNVKLFSLENFKGDMFLSEVYYAYMNLTRKFGINQRAFISGQFEYDYEILQQAENQIKDKLRELKIKTRTSDYNIKSLQSDMIKSAQNGTELIVLDHLDYVDKDNPNENDVAHITQLMKTIRECQEKHGCAIVGVSHLRKNNGKDLPAIPSVDEFIGSSNKVKQSTLVIMVAPDDIDNQENCNSNIKKTWCCIRKSRFGGIDNKVASLKFNRSSNKYMSDYEEMSVDYQGKEIKEIN